MMNKQLRDENVPTLTTERLICRRIQDVDATALHAIWSDPEVTKYFSLEPFESIDETREMMTLLNRLPAASQGIRWVIVRHADGTILGTCGFHNYRAEHHRAEIGYELGRPYWRQGFMSEAVGAILRYGFMVADYNRIEAFVNYGNQNSTRLLDRNGFRLDGLLRQYELNRGKFVDQYCYSLLKSDWQAAGTDSGRRPK
ncbi:MAG: GNAT family N-acetyltransferase [Veillonellaceae bacterium]|nr:GNAT family N-acetyltransferase [Veillonellaceae bacterium]